MGTSFTIAANNNSERHTDRVSVGDVVLYQFDFTPWQEDNHTITSVTWTVESGQAGISGQALTSGAASALVTFSQVGKSLISILATTAAEKKKVWLEVYADDHQLEFEDGYS